MERLRVICVYGIFFAVGGCGIGLAIRVPDLSELQRQLQAAQRERDQAIQELRKPILVAEVPKRFMPKMENLPKGTPVQHVMPSTDCVIWYREVDGPPSGPSDSLQSVKPVSALVRANADGVNYFLWLYPDDASPIQIPR